MQKISKKIVSGVLSIGMLLGIIGYQCNTKVRADSGTSSVTDVDDTGLVAHYKFDGDLKDSSSNGNDGEEIGNITFEDSVLGKGAKFDGKSYIEVKDSDSLDLEKDFTFSLWIKKDDQIPRGQFVPYITKLNEPDQIDPYTIREWWFGDPEVGLFDLEDEANQFCIPSGTFIDWGRYELLTITGDGSSVKIYINNKLTKSEPSKYGFVKSSLSLWIGMFNHLDKGYFYKGIMDDLRIYNRALSYSEVQTLYNAGISGNHSYLINPPKNLVAFYRFENNFNDSTFFKNNGTKVESKGGIKFVDGVVGKAAKFNGASYIQVEDSPWLNPEKEFTFSAWVKPDNNTTTQPLLRKYGATTEQEKSITAYQLAIELQNLETLLSMHDGSEIKSNVRENVDTGIKSNYWYDVTVSYKNGTIKTYINGKLIKSTNLEDGSEESDLSYSSGKLIIGSLLDDVFYKGIMDELRIYNYALSDAQIKNLYMLKDSMSVFTTAGTYISKLSLNAKSTYQLNVVTSILTFAAQADMFSSPNEGFIKTNVTTKAKYLSSNTKIVAVSSGGKITSVKKGKANITVTYGKFKQVIPVNVK